MLIEVLKDSESFNIGPWIKFGEIGSFSPYSFKPWQLWSLKAKFEEKDKLGPPLFRIWQFIPLGESLKDLQNWSLHFQNYTIGP